MRGGSNVTPALAAEHGLTEEEFDRAVAILGRMLCRQRRENPILLQVLGE